MGFYALQENHAPGKTTLPPANPCPENCDPLTKNRVWKFFPESENRVGENDTFAQCSRLENPLVVTITASDHPLWPNRDPIGEWGGLNLYGFLDNDPVGLWDFLGLMGRPPPPRPPGPTPPVITPPEVGPPSDYQCQSPIQSISYDWPDPNTCCTDGQVQDVVRTFNLGDRTEPGINGSQPRKLNYILTCTYDAERVCESDNKFHIKGTLKESKGEWK